MDEKKSVSIIDVAAKAGVAISSVSRALSSHPDVSPAMRDKVFAAAEALGYTPDPGAQSLRSGFTRTIGFVVRDFANPVFGDIIHGVEETLSGAGYTLLVTNSGGDPAREVDRLELLRQRRVDALLFSSISEGASKVTRALNRLERPVVLLDRDPARAKVSSVVLDHALGVQEATENLLDLGHRRIAIVTGSTAIRPTRERLRGYVDAHVSRGVEAAEELQVTGAFSAPFAREATAQMLALSGKARPTALIAGGVQATIGMLEAMSAAGVRPGDDLSLVVCDDLPWLRVLGPRISVVARDAEAMGRAAAELAVEQIRGSKPRTVIQPTSYEIRETSRRPSG